jgi:photosystem II stability/assembly factor-like uncharacterized protein
MKRIWGVMIVMSLLLAGCGTLEVQLERDITATPQPQVTQPGPAVATATPTDEAPVLPTDTVRPTAQVVKGRAAPGQFLTIQKLFMLDSLNGWCIGTVDSGPDDHIFRTFDGGETWRDLTPPVLPSNLGDNSLAAEGAFVSPMQAWVVYFPRQAALPDSKVVVWSTENGGQTWDASQALDLSGIPAEFFIAGSLGFLDRQHGWLLVHLGAGMSHDYVAIFSTADGGATWQRVADPQSISSLMGCGKTGLSFTDAQNAWLAGDCPGLMSGLFFYHSQDGGKNWNQVMLPAPSGTQSDLFSRAENGCGILGIPYSSADALVVYLRCQMYEDSNPRSWLVSSRDGGMTWSSRGLPAPFGHLYFLDERNAWLLGTLAQDNPAGGAELFRSTDGGGNWVSVLPVGWQGEPIFVDSDHGWVVAQAGGNSALVYSTNGGEVWREIRPVTAP